MSVFLIAILVSFLYVWRNLWRYFVLPGIRIDAAVTSPSIPYGTATQIDFTVQNSSRLPAPHVTCQLVLPPQMRLVPPTDAAANDEKANRIAFTVGLKPRETVTVRFQLYGCKRGRAVIPIVHAELSDGLFTRYHEELSTHLEMVVHPVHTQVARRREPPQRDLGPIAAPRKLYPSSLDWIDMRAYQPGDSIRDIAWMASARRQSLIVLERSMAVRSNIILIANAQTIREHWLGTIPETVEKVYEETMRLAIQFLQGDVGSVSVYSNAYSAPRSRRKRYRVARVTGGKTPRSILSLGHGIGRLPVYCLAPLSELLASTVRDEREPSDIVLVTAYEDDLSRQACRQLQAQGHRLHVVSVPAASAADMTRAADAATRDRSLSRSGDTRS
ncbi:MAG: DUF58 domain-containing protein [Bacilli bacterium]